MNTKQCIVEELMSPHSAEAVVDPQITVEHSQTLNAGDGVSSSCSTLKSCAAYSQYGELLLGTCVAGMSKTVIFTPPGTVYQPLNTLPRNDRERLPNVEGGLDQQLTVVR